jgi:hypothetical protein
LAGGAVAVTFGFFAGNASALGFWLVVLFFGVFFFAVASRRSTSALRSAVIVGLSPFRFDRADAMFLMIRAVAGSILVVGNS